MHEKNNITQFTDKYTKSSSIGGQLVKNFFRSIQSVTPKNPKHVLEAGCGAGYSTQKLVEFFGKDVQFSACDIDPELVLLAQDRNPSVDCKMGSIYNLPYADHSFDLVYCLEVLEHLDNPKDALSELARVSKKYVIISTPNEPLWRILNMLRGKYIKSFGNTHGHINHWSSQKLCKLVSGYFDIIIKKNPLPWTVIYGKSKNIQ